MASDSVLRSRIANKKWHLEQEKKKCWDEVGHGKHYEGNMQRIHNIDVMLEVLNALNGT